MYIPKTLVFILLLTSFLLPGCRRSSDEVWTDAKSAGRHVTRGVKTLGGKHGESRQLQSGDEFLTNRTHEKEFIPLQGAEETNNPHVSSQSIPREFPGEPGSSIPGIELFQDPEEDKQLTEIFEHVRFPYNSTLIKGEKNMAIIKKIALWMKQHPKAYVFIEGHCDSRGSSAYNFALGANRANAVRNLLMSEGVDHNKLFTISYGKERPLLEGTGEQVWQYNRRAQFKIYQEG